MDSYQQGLGQIHQNLLCSVVHGASMDGGFCVADPAAHRAKFQRPTAPRTKKASAGAAPPTDSTDGPATPKFKVDEYLDRMPNLRSIIDKALHSGAAPFEGVSLFLVHHLTAEILGTIAALRALGCKDLVTVFVGYNADAEAAYSPDLNDLPENEFRCFILKSTTASGGGAQGIYSVKQDFPEGSKMAEDIPYVAMNKAMAEGTDNKAMDFLQAMRCLCVPLFLKQLAKAKTGNQKHMIIEDGGYLTPIINDAALGGKTVAELRAAHQAPKDSATDTQLDSNVEAALKATMVGTVEHTRNGYDRDVLVNKKYGGKLCIPAFSIAVSKLKTQSESDIVASSILNAVTSALYSHGCVLQRRNVLIFGSRGNIGRRTMVYLTGRLEHETGENGEKSQPIKLIGCDLKVNAEPTSMKGVPKWQHDPKVSSVPNCVEKGTYAEFGAQRVRDVDVILGITGGPTPGHPVLQVKDVEDWLLHSKKENLYLASGSSKTDEFPEILEWMDKLLSKAENGVAHFEIDGTPGTVTKQHMTDVVSKRDFGGQFVFAIAQDDGSFTKKILLFLNNLLPVNFMFYGVPTEVIDEVLSQIIDASISLRRKVADNSLPHGPRLYAVDFDIAASKGIFKSKVPDQDLPLPLPAQS